MSGRIGLQYPGAFEGGSGVLSEIDRALAVIGAAHWIENSAPPLTQEIGPKAPRSIGRFGASTPVPAVPAECLLTVDSATRPAYCP